MYAGHDGRRFFLKSADGGFQMNFSGQVQARYIYNIRDNAGDTTRGNDTGGVQMRRVKFGVAGHIADPRITYAMTFSNNRNTNATIVEAVTLGYKVNDNLSLYGGRYKDRFLREEFTSSGRQLTVERSGTADLFTNKFVEGIGMVYSMDMFRFDVNVNDGFRSGNGGSGDFHTDGNDIGITARVDVTLAGKSGQMADFTAWEGEEMAAFIGAAVTYQVGETGGSATANNNILKWTVDGSIEVEGFNFFAAVMGQHDTKRETAGGTSLSKRDDYGFVIQGGYQIIPNKVEPFVRYEFVTFDNARTRAPLPDTFNDIHIITAGVNLYQAKHNAKLTADVVYGINEIHSAFSPSNGQGLLTDGFKEKGQIALRLQYQLLF
jgi:hypothetical protein